MQLSLTLEQAQSGYQPPKLSKKQWKKLHNATKKYEFELFWRRFQYCLQKVELSQRKREELARIEHQKNKPRPYKDG